MAFSVSIAHSYVNFCHHAKVNVEHSLRISYARANMTVVVVEARDRFGTFKGMLLPNMWPYRVIQRRDVDYPQLVIGP